MKIRTKILLLLLLGALVPLSVSYFFADQIIYKDFSRNLQQRAENDAAQIVARTDDRIDWMLEVVTMVVDAVPFENLSETELPQALNITYNQLTFATMVALLDSNGKAVVPPYRPTTEIAAHARRAYVSDKEMSRFANNVPFDASLKATLAIGPVYFSESKTPRIVVTKSISIGENHQWVLAIGVSLENLCDVVAGSASNESVDTALADSSGTSVCGKSESAIYDIPAMMQTKVRIRKVTEHKVEGTEYFLVQARVPTTGWRIFYQYSKTAAFEKFYQIRKAVFIWIGICLVAALVGAFFLARGITAPIGKLATASSRVADGNYDKKIEEITKDELGDLSISFNRMVDEIQTWNKELHDRVNDKTKALKEAQEQIVKTQKLAALGELGAGVAHEINNPLTAVVGNAQLLLQELEHSSGHRDIILDIVNNSRRVAEVVDDLLRFSQAQWGETMLPVSIEKVMIKSVDLYLERFKEKEIEVAWKQKDDVNVFGIERDLQIVATSLLDNALKAIGQGGQILFTLRKIEQGAILWAIEDNGTGMDETTRIKAIDPFFSTHPPGMGSRGIGLTTVQRILDEHEAKMTIESSPGHGTIISIYFASEISVSKA